MKTISQSEYKMHDAITFILFVIMVCIIFIVALTHQSCTTVRTYHDMSATQKEQFDACIEYHPSDAVCDSCWNAIVKR